MYRWDPKEYAQSSSEQQRWAEELLDKLQLRGREHVLDVGCGDGKVTAEIATRLPQGHVTGVDFAPEMVDFARRGFPPDCFPNLSFAVADARDLPFNSEFDVLFSNAALHWIRNHVPVLQSFRRSLRPGGRTLLQMGGRGNAADMMEVLDDLMVRPRWAGWFEGFTFPYGFHGDEEYTVWVREAGLEPIRVELILKLMLHPGREGLAGWVRTTWLPYTQRVPEDQREEFIEEILDEYLSRNPLDSDGMTRVRMVRLEVEATRPRE